MIPAPAAARVPGRRELVLFAALACALILLRSWVFLVHERFFDSDQAIIGLMAKHLSEFRGFPLFFYGQHYMLGVQAWTAVPFFWLGGPTMTMLRVPIEIWNMGIVIGFMVVLTRMGIRPGLAFVAMLPFIVTTTAVSKEMLSVLGASVEPFAYVLGLWTLRTRPMAFGALLCFGSLHREFTGFALPALAVAAWPSRRHWNWKNIALGALAFAAVWATIDLLKRHLSAVGPSETAIAAGSLLMQMQSIGNGLSGSPARYFPRLWQVVSIGVPHFLGAKPYAMNDYGITSTLHVGSYIGGAAFLLAMLVSGWRLFQVRHAGQDPRFFVYLVMIAVVTILVYGTNDNLEVGLPVQLRYILFVLLVPIALLAMYFQRETQTAWRWSVVALVATWAAFNVRDNVRLVREFEVAPIPAYHRHLADYLVAHRVKYAWGGYWDSYIVDFFSREQVIVASTEKVRIASYQQEVTDHDSEAVELVRRPCDGGTSFEAWCLKGAPIQ